MLHYVRRFALRYGLAKHGWYRLHEKGFCERLHARFLAISWGMDVLPARESIYPYLSTRVDGVRKRPKHKSLAVTYAKLDKIVEAVDAAAERAYAHSVRC